VGFRQCSHRTRPGTSWERAFEKLERGPVNVGLETGQVFVLGGRWQIPRSCPRHFFASRSPIQFFAALTAQPSPPWPCNRDWLLLSPERCANAGSRNRTARISASNFRAPQTGPLAQRYVCDQHPKLPTDAAGGILPLGRASSSPFPLSVILCFYTTLLVCPTTGVSPRVSTCLLNRRRTHPMPLHGWSQRT